MSSTASLSEGATRERVGSAAYSRPVRIGEYVLFALTAVLLFAFAGSEGLGGDYPIRPIVFVLVLTGLCGLAANELIARDDSVGDAIAGRVTIALTTAAFAFAGAFVCGEPAVYPIGALLSVVALWRIGSA